MEHWGVRFETDGKDDTHRAAGTLGPCPSAQVVALRCTRRRRQATAEDPPEPSPAKQTTRYVVAHARRRLVARGGTLRTVACRSCGTTLSAASACARESSNAASSSDCCVLWTCACCRSHHRCHQRQRPCTHGDRSARLTSKIASRCRRSSISPTSAPVEPSGVTQRRICTVESDDTTRGT
jgi:hypothetical protein